MQSIEDERQIIALINRYATGLDTADWALLRSCWADDVEVDYGTGETWSSADALNAFMEHFHSGLTTGRIFRPYCCAPTARSSSGPPVGTTIVL